MKAAGERAAGARGTPRVLVVEDDDAMRDLLVEELAEAGFQVQAAANGREGVERVRREPVDLVITDVNMPNMDGLALVRELRRLPQYRGVPLLMLTTESSAERKQEGRAAGATGWIVKPFDPDRLLATVEKVLS